MPRDRIMTRPADRRVIIDKLVEMAVATPDQKEQAVKEMCALLGMDPGEAKEVIDIIVRSDVGQRATMVRRIERWEREALKARLLDLIDGSE